MIGISILLAVVIYVWLARFVARRIANQAAKYIVIALFILIPTWDIIPGKLYFNYLCTTKSEIRVYSTVHLPAEYWDMRGQAKFYVDWDSHLGKKYPLLYTQEAYSPVFYIDNAGYKFVDKQSGQVLGEVVDFRYWGSWIVRNFSSHNTATTCNPSGNLIDNIFKPSN